MKKFYSLSSTLLLSLGLFAQTHEYFFAGNFTEKAALTPALTQLVSCTAAAGTFPSQVITTTTGNCSASASQVFSFAKGGGFSYSNASFISTTYTIHLFFKFNTLAGFQRIIDFKNSTLDQGIYTQATCLNFYPNGSVGTCPFFAVNTYYLLSVVRSANLVNVYVNGNPFVVNYNDAAGNNTPSTATTPLIFFRDDNAVPCETAAGSVKYLSIKNSGSTAAQVLAVWSGICSTALPLDLISFDAKAIEKNIALKWKTENELNVAHIDIERSNDGQVFTLLKRMAAKNNIVNNYQWVDSTVNYSSETAFYYRLKMIDVGGAFKYSKILKMGIKKIDDFVFFPNPTKNNIQINNLKRNDVIKIISLNGTTLLTRIAKNDFEIINLQQYPQGSYIIQLQNNAGVKHKIVEKL